MGEILNLMSDVDWVVLSACNTGTGNGAGAEAVSGFGLAFSYVGTRALLVSNWPVETTSAKALTTELYRRQAEDASLTRAEAHGCAMLALIEKGVTSIRRRVRWCSLKPTPSSGRPSLSLAMAAVASQGPNTH
jgi:CHAT domain-containing protein